jgi:hypothetical protein
MKKILLSAALLSLAFTSTSFANDGGGINKQVIKSFQREFATAREVNWQNSREYTKAKFSLNGHVMTAYFASSGNLIAVTRNILADQLPITLFSDLKKNYSKTWITDLFELAKDGETYYYVTLEDSDSILTIRSTGTNGWEVYKKINKDTE